MVYPTSSIERYIDGENISKNHTKRMWVWVLILVVSAATGVWAENKFQLFECAFILFMLPQLTLE